MAITTAVQKGSVVYVYGENGRQLCIVPAGTGPNDGLQGYTGATISVRKGAAIYVYYERGRQLSVHAGQ